MQEPGVVLDPYSGSGTTGLAATLLGHQYIGFDLSEKYHEMARKRIENPSETDIKKFFDEVGNNVQTSTSIFDRL